MIQLANASHSINITPNLQVPANSVKRLVPIPNPDKILCLAGNYPKHVSERGGIAVERKETFPYVFTKPNSTLTNPGDPIVLPKPSPNHIDWECELAIVIGRTCRDASEQNALDFVAGYTIVNDVSDREFKPNPNRKPRERDKFFDWLHGKWHDTFCPLGPSILMADSLTDPTSFSLELSVNGEVMQSDTTNSMIFPVPHIISFISSWITLQPGDIIATGTPSGVGSARGRYLRPGDIVEASISNIGVLKNPVVATS
jgi:2-keto-4-pentenoate hydratase/2-oxohepta-3-ene-1,7-dioic acid hydratase in catechol pathway